MPSSAPTGPKGAVWMSACRPSQARPTAPSVPASSASKSTPVYRSIAGIVGAERSPALTAT